MYDMFVWEGFNERQELACLFCAHLNFSFYGFIPVGYDLPTSPHLHMEPTWAIKWAPYGIVHRLDNGPILKAFIGLM